MTGEQKSLCEARSRDNREGTCVTGKVRYANDLEAAMALDRVRKDRAERPDDKPPERVFYECRHCDGWHLSSRPPEIVPPPAAKGDGETWEEYAHRLERRIKQQRDSLEAINALRADAGTRHERKRIAHLQAALGRMTAKWDEEKQARLGLVDAIQRRTRLDVEAALDLLAQEPMESGKEIGELIDERRARMNHA